MLLQSEVRARISKDMKDEVTVILESMGIDTSLAIRIYFQEIINQGRLPFEWPTRRAVPEMTAARKSALSGKPLNAKELDAALSHIKLDKKD